VAGSAEHLEWLALTEVTGPFLTLPVLSRVWPTLDAVDKGTRDQLRLVHAESTGDPDAWLDWVLCDLLAWGDQSRRDDLANLAVNIPEHDATVTPSFVLDDPSGGELRLLGMTYPPGTHPTARIKGDPWPATPVDRVAILCRHHDVELGLVTDSRWWALVWAPRGGVTTAAVFDSMTWPDAADLVVVRAFKTLLHRTRFFGVAEALTLPRLLKESIDNQEEVTERLGIQVRRAVEQLVDAIGRADTRARKAGSQTLGEEVTAHDVYRGGVSVLMRLVFLLFAEERGLLPSDNPVYEAGYSAGRLCEDLERRASEATEDALEHSSAAWSRLLALFTAIHGGVEHPRLTLSAYDGSVFDPQAHPWLAELVIDDRTVLHMLRSVQYVVISRERRRLSFRALDVEQIGYVYEGLLSYDAYHADQTIVSLIGKEGLEEEVPLAELETIAAMHPTPNALAAKLAETYKDSRIGTPRALERALQPPAGATRSESITQLLAATEGDRDLAERLLPFFGIVRRDLRDLRLVILGGALYVTASPLRRTTGTHYTPSFLARQVVEAALEPLVYSPGSLQTADKAAWNLRSSTEILALKVADIAMGSGAFLVAACRYLADRLVEAWSEEGDSRARELLAAGDHRVVAADAEADALVLAARREVITHCLYGVDINPMAVEMAKLSLWLVSMDTSRPFTFLDDRLDTGDSLLGITSLDQIEAMHIDAARGRRIHQRLSVDLVTGVRSVAQQVADQRRKLAGLPADDLDALAEKQRMLAAVEEQTRQARLFGDLVVGAALMGCSKAGGSVDDWSVQAANEARWLVKGDPATEASLRGRVAEWLRKDQPSGGFSRTPLHWPLVFPEVFEAGGFDAVIGNPPFLGGQKLTGALGEAYREYLVATMGRGARGSADLVAYFLLRTHQLLRGSGQSGLIATNTLAQGDTREVGLDQLMSDGVEIRQAVKSEPWPSRSAVLQYAAIWSSRARVDEQATRVLDGVPVPGITSSLDPRSRVSGAARRLVANTGVAYQGSIVLGMGFTMSPDDAQALIHRDPRNAEVLFPYLNGQDLNSRPDSSASRWVINFHDWPEARAAQYPECYDQVRRLVKPERDRNNRKVYRDHWWHYAEKRPAMVEAIKGLDRVIVITLVSKVVMPVLVPTGQVFSHMLGVFATDDAAMLALLSSAPHYWWAISRASTMKGDLRYTPTDVFETLGRPEPTEEMHALGDRVDSFRRDLMLSRQAGLTATYNLVHDPACADDDIVELRSIHRAIDEAVVGAYGWEDLLDAGLDHEFHDTRQGVRYTVGPVVRQEILDRLLELNHERYAEEVAAGLHKGKSASSEQGELFE
jgi:hypothetical protein